MSDTLDLSEKLAEKQKIQELQAEIERLLIERPEYRPFQEMVLKELDKAGKAEDIHIPHDLPEGQRLKLEERKRIITTNRLSFIGSMMFESFETMIKNVKLLKKECEQLHVENIKKQVEELKPKE